MSLDAQVRIRRGGFDVRARLEAADGETLALLGPNGAGKSTVVEALAGLVPLHEGHVRIDGVPIAELPPEARPIGVLFQDPLLFPHLSALANVAFPLRARRAPKADAERAAAELLAQIAPGLDPGSRPRTLSGGQAQRVALARALAPRPRLLLLDEPLAAVDASARSDLRRLLRELVAEFDGSCVLVAHDPLDALTLADQVVILEDGRVTQSGTPAEIQASPRSRYAADLVGVNLFVGRLEPGRGGVGVLHVGAGRLTVVWPGGAPGTLEDVVAVLRPSDVALHISRPEGSPRNVLHGRVDEVAVVGDRARVRIASTPALTAEVTTGSVDRLSLSPGLDVWAAFKAVEVRLELPEATRTLVP